MLYSRSMSCNDIEVEITQERRVTSTGEATQRGTECQHSANSGMGASDLERAAVGTRRLCSLSLEPPALYRAFNAL